MEHLNLEQMVDGVYFSSLQLWFLQIHLTPAILSSTRDPVHIYFGEDINPAQNHLVLSGCTISNSYCSMIPKPWGFKRVSNCPSHFIPLHRGTPFCVKSSVFTGAWYCLIQQIWTVLPHTPEILFYHSTEGFFYFPSLPLKNSTQDQGK